MTSATHLSRPPLGPSIRPRSALDSARNQAIIAALRGGRPQYLVARDHGISRQRVHQLLRRFSSAGPPRGKVRPQAREAGK